MFSYSPIQDIQESVKFNLRKGRNQMSFQRYFRLSFQIKKIRDASDFELDYCGRSNAFDSNSLLKAAF